MDNLAVYMRITGLTVSDADVDSRRSAADDLAGAWRGGKSTDATLAKAVEIAAALGGDGTPPAALAAEVQAAVQDHASAFLAAERPLEVGIVAASAVIRLVDGRPSVDWSWIDVLAAALWLALSYQPALGEPKREAMRKDTCEAVRRWCLTAAENSRERSAVADFGALEIKDAEGDDAKIETNFAEATAATIRALRRNAALDREELDFLWWAQLGRSRLLARSHSSLAESTRLVAAGIEGATYLRRLPCEVHRDIVLRTVEKDPELDLKKLLRAIEPDRAKLGAPHADRATKWPAIFALLSALATGNDDGEADAIKRKASEWGARALLEAGFDHLLTKGSGKL